MSKNKLGLGIVAFEGTELIAQIVMEIRDLVDYVVVGFQKYSYTGEICDPNDEYEIKKLKEEGIIDEYIYISTDVTDFPRVQETDKRNEIVDNLIEHGCTHQLITDCDEFYSHDSFARAKEKVYKENIEISYCRYVNYFHDYQHYLVYPFEDGTYVPFIAKTKYRFSWQCTDFEKPSDPTRRYVRPKRILKDKKTGLPIIRKVQHTIKGRPVLLDVPEIEYLVDNYVFEWKELKMHHLSWLRNNIRKKMNAWSSKSYFENYLEIIDKSAKRFDDFDDNDQIKETFLLFNTPGNKLNIQKFNKQYIFPKEEYDYRNRVNHCPYNRNLKRFEIDDSYQMLNLLQIFSNNIQMESYKGHNNEDEQRPKKIFDFVVLGQIEDEDKVINLVNSLQKEHVIYFDEKEKFVIVGFDSMLKIIKMYNKDEFKECTWKEGIKQFMKKYCDLNELNYNEYIQTIKVEE